MARSVHCEPFPSTIITSGTADVIIMNTNTPNKTSSQYRKNMSKQIAVAFFSDCDILRPKMENWMRRMVRVELRRTLDADAGKPHHGTMSEIAQPKVGLTNV